MSLQSSTTLVLGLAFHLEVSVTIALFGSRGWEGSGRCFQGGNY